MSPDFCYTYSKISISFLYPMSHWVFFPEKDGSHHAAQSTLVWKTLYHLSVSKLCERSETLAPVTCFLKHVWRHGWLWTVTRPSGMGRPLFVALSPGLLSHSAVLYILWLRTVRLGSTTVRWTKGPAPHVFFTNNFDLFKRPRWEPTEC